MYSIYSCKLLVSLLEVKIDVVEVGIIEVTVTSLDFTQDHGMIFPLIISYTVTV